MEERHSYEYADHNYIRENKRRLSEIAAKNKKIKRQRMSRNNFIFSFLIYIFCIFILFSVAYKIVERNSQIVKIKSELIQMDKVIAEKKIEKELIKSDISRNLDLMMIEKNAINELNMIYPKPSQIIYISKDWKYTLKEEINNMKSANLDNKGLINEE